MANDMRVLYENITDLSYKLLANASQGNLLPANLRNDLKSEVWRCNTTTGQLTIAWTLPRPMNMCALMFTNLTSTAQMKVRGWTTEADLNPVFDTGYQLACTYAPLGNLNWGSFPLGVNAFRFGGISHARSYFGDQTVAKLVIDIMDPDNLSGYVEAARLVTGSYWAPECNPAYGAELLYKFYTAHEETQSGDLRTERRPRRRGLNFNMQWIKTQQDQYAMHEIMLAAGMDTPIFVSLFPENPDPLLEQRYQMWAKLDGDHTMSHPQYGIFSIPMRLLEI